MSRIDTTSNAEMYLRGASLGTQQFGVLANLAQQQLQNERTARLDATSLEQTGLENARNARNDDFNQWARVEGLRIDTERLDLAKMEEARRQEEAARKAEETRREMESREVLSGVLAGTLRDQLRATRAAQEQAYTQQLMLQNGGGATGLRGAVAAGGTGAAMNPAGLSTAGRTERPVAGVHGSLNAGGLAGRTAAGDGREASGSVGPLSAMFQVDHRADPQDQRFETAIGIAELTNDVEMLQTLQKLVDDKAERAAAFDRAVALQKFPVEMLAEPWDQALARLYIKTNNLNGLAQLGRTGRLEALKGQSFEQTFANVKAIVPGISDEDASFATMRIERGDKAEAGQVIDELRARNNEGPLAQKSIEMKIRRAEKEVDDLEQYRKNLAGGRLTSPQDLKDADEKIEKAKQRVNTLQQAWDRAAGLPTEDVPPEEKPGPELPEDAVLEMNGQVIPAKVMDPTELQALWNEAQRVWAQRNKRQPTENDVPAIIAVRNELAQARSTR